MFVVNNYATAVILCIVTMLCWGSWGNTQKLAGRTWRYELFYWDYVVGMLLFSLILCFTLGSIGSEGRPFLEDLAQAAPKALGRVLLGGVIFNASNILLSASVSLAGLAVAFPLGVGLALVLGVVINYMGAPKGDPVILFLGVVLIVIAIVCNGIASGRVRKEPGSSAQNRKGILLAVLAGVLMSFFYRFVAAAMDSTTRIPHPGMRRLFGDLIFSVGVLLSNFVFNTLVMKRPFVGTPVGYDAYFKGQAAPIWSGCWAARSGVWVRRSAISPQVRPGPPFPMRWDRVRRWSPPSGAFSSERSSGARAARWAGCWRSCSSSLFSVWHVSFSPEATE